MSQVTIRQISQDDIESLHSCLDSVAQERKYLGFIRAAPIEETRKSLGEDMERGVIRLIALDASKVVGWRHIRPDRWEGLTYAGWLGMGVLVELGVYASNLTAIHLYENFRFEFEGRRRELGNLMEAMTISSLCG